MRNEILPVIKRLPGYGQLAYELYRSANLSGRQKIVLGAGLAYLLSPIDVVPGFIPVIGQLDDIIIALTALRKVLKSLPPESRNRYLAHSGLKMAMIDKDLGMLKKIAGKITRQTAGYVTSGMFAAGKMAIAGTLFFLRSSCRLARMALTKGEQVEKHR